MFNYIDPGAAATAAATIGIQERIMSIAKIIEISAESTDSFEDAIRQGIEAAAKTVRNIQAAWVKEQSVVVHAGKISKYRVDLKLTFVLD
jgi:flavin-binding protein dodecin